MTISKHVKPLESYAPELLDLLLRGAQSPVEVKLSYKECVNTRLRLAQLRVTMRKLDHPMTKLAERAQVKIIIPADTPSGIRLDHRRNKYPRDKNDICILQVSPVDHKIAGLLRAQGIDGGLTGDALGDAAPPRPRPLEDEDGASFIERLYGEVSDPKPRGAK